MHYFIVSSVKDIRGSSSGNGGKDDVEYAEEDDVECADDMRTCIVCQSVVQRVDLAPRTRRQKQVAEYFDCSRCEATMHSECLQRWAATTSSAKATCPKCRSAAYEGSGEMRTEATINSGTQRLDGGGAREPDPASAAPRRPRATMRNFNG
eukprot:scaffold4779_cov315-Pinguiococcus_pyrenoidosus.AAC.2